VTESQHNFDILAPGRALSAYLLGTLDFEAFFALQRRLIYDVGGDRTAGAVVLCDHPTGVTIGREGSRLHVRPNFDRLNARFYSQAQAGTAFPRSPVQWVGRGGGAMLHLPGQVACYPILPLDLVGLTPARYIENLLRVALDLLRTFNIIGSIDFERPGIRVNGRRVIHLGVAVRQRITCFGLVVNANPKLEWFHEIDCDGDPQPMTSLQRESAGCIRLTAIRQRLVELIAARFAFDRVSIFHNHPGIPTRAKRYVAAPRS
jgi:lipoyl(octanoyl) transferase